MSDADEVIIGDAALRVACIPSHGFVISEFSPTGVGNLLWSRERVHAVRDLPLTASTVAESDDFDEAVFIGGWFGMFPTAGIPGAADGDRIVHGDLSRVRWRVRSRDRASIAATAEARPGFSMTRTLSVHSGVLTVDTVVRNDTEQVQLVAFGEHPCLSRAAFRAGRIRVDGGAIRVPGAVSDPVASTFRAGSTGTWPWVLGRDGTLKDASRIPAAVDGTHDHVIMSSGSGAFAVEAPLLGGRLEFSIDSEMLPHLLLWRHFRPVKSPWNGDVFSPEMMSIPGRSLDDLGARDSLLPLKPGKHLGWRATAEWRGA
ncbi:hypothetical protein [Microbacterium saperdae]|uniref:Galactose mutarotase-like enzyme n=1 Tax=Microbacterium saperdae TaxID=69368 RepID=A0A543BIR9_9MICO|nr:hypothetical protein [Microbacterium saperdae]TQL84760.1 hypothetical protein FB560_0352 [Microbacterium saperdae]GGM64251.1 hypothetical protein GCM10010489_39880 [Microbacterium saperdae]